MPGFFTAANAAEYARKSHAPGSARFKHLRVEAPTVQPAIPPAEPAADFAARRLSRVREQLDRIDALAAQEDDPKRLKELADATTRLSEQERVLAGRPLPGSRRPAPDNDRSRRRQSDSILDDHPPAAPVVAPTTPPSPAQPDRPIGWEYDNATGTLASCPDDPTQST